MNRIITWSSGLLDEIELVYQRAEEDNVIGELLEKLERAALQEAEAAFNGGLIKKDDFSSGDFAGLPDPEKELVIVILANGGLIPKQVQIASSTIVMRLTPIIQEVMACTVFDILNRLEKLDGAVNIISPKWTLQLEVPLGGRKGLVPWTILIAKSYPWITVSEISSNEMSSTLAKMCSIDRSPEPEDSGIAPEPDSKPSADTSGPEEKDDAHVFLKAMSSDPSFQEAMQKAEKELETVITGGIYKKLTEKDLSSERWANMSRMERQMEIISMGLFSFIVRSVVCVDFLDYNPYCAAIGLLFAAWSGKLKKQLIDAGDGVDVRVFAEALNQLHHCCPEWTCTIAHPVFIRIGESPAEPKRGSVPADQEEKTEKKPFWNKWFRKQEP